MPTVYISSNSPFGWDASVPTFPIFASREMYIPCLPMLRVAVLSLIFAASRCGELPELHLSRNIFKELSGPEFVAANVKLPTMNLVDPQIKQNLCIKLVPDDVKLTIGAEVMDLEILDASIDSDKYWAEAPKSETPTSHFSLSNSKNLAVISDPSPINSIAVSAMSIDDIKQKALNQEDLGKIIPNNVKNLGRGNGCRKSGFHGQMFCKDRLFFYSSFADRRLMQHKKSPSHVRPKLPDKEDVAKIMYFKT